MKKLFYGFIALASTSIVSCSKSDTNSISPGTSYITIRSVDGRTAQLNTTLNGSALRLGDTTWAYSVNYVERTVTGTAYTLLFTTTGSVAFQSGTVYKSLQTGRTDSTYNLVFEGVSYSN